MKNALVYFKTQSEYHFEKMQKAVDAFGKSGIWFDNIEVLYDVANMSELMTSCDIGITSSLGNAEEYEGSGGA